jgi:hypothetical protein
MDHFRINTSVLNGMTQAQMQVALTAAQQAYVAFMTGSKGESFSYSQGEGSRSVTYTRATLPQLTAFISELQAALGMRRRARQPVRFFFS